MPSEQSEGRPAAIVPRYVKGSTALHKCDPNIEEVCECPYDSTCTGRFGRRLVRVPLWIDFILRPRHNFMVLRARRILKANGAWHERA